MEVLEGLTHSTCAAAGRAALRRQSFQHRTGQRVENGTARLCYSTANLVVSPEIQEVFRIHTKNANIRTVLACNEQNPRSQKITAN